MGQVALAFYGIATIFTKLSVLLFFLRFLVRRLFRIIVYILIVTMVLYYLIGSFEFVYYCQPITKLWDFTITYGSYVLRFTVPIINAATNSATDLAILLLPWFLLWNIQLPIRQKIRIYILLATGG
jgi:hypothetical protein